MKANLEKLNQICVITEPRIQPFLNQTIPSLDHIMAWLYLMPLESPTEEQHRLSAAFLFLQISRNCHESVRAEDGSFNSEGVLLGDLFVSHAYHLILNREESKLLSEVADIVMASNEAWFTFLTLDSQDKEAQKLGIYKELGQILEKCAEKGSKDAHWEEGAIAAYKKCAKDIGFLWGGKRHNLSINSDEMKASILEQAKGLNIETEIEAMLALL